MDKRIYRPIMVIGGMAFLFLFLVITDFILYLGYFTDNEIEMLYGAIFMSIITLIWMPIIIIMITRGTIILDNNEISGNFLLWSDEEKQRLRPKKAFNSIEIKHIRSFNDIYAPKPRSGAEYLFLFETNRGEKIYLSMTPFSKKQKANLKKNITRLLEFSLPKDN